MIFTSRGSDGFPDGRQGYLLDGFGGLHQWGGAPVLAGLPYTPNQDIWRGAEIHFDASGVPDGGWEMDRTGRVVAFGAAPALSVSLPTAPIHQQLHLVGSGGYVVDKWGIVTAFGTGLSPNWNGYTDWGGRDIIRDIALVNLFVRRDAFTGFDESIGYIGEDTALLASLLQRGRVVYHDGVRVTHRRRAFPGPYLRQRWRYRVKTGRRRAFTPKVRAFLAAGTVAILVAPLAAIPYYLVTLILGARTTRLPAPYWPLIPFFFAAHHATYYFGILWGFIR